MGNERVRQGNIVGEGGCFNVRERSYDAGPDTRVRESTVDRGMEKPDRMRLRDLGRLLVRKRQFAASRQVSRVANTSLSEVGSMTLTFSTTSF